MKAKLKKINCLRVFCLMFTILFVSANVWAQTDELITPVLKGKERKNTRIMEKVEKLRKNPLKKSVDFVKFGNLKQILEKNKGYLPFKVPGINKKFMAYPWEVEFESERNYKWIGKIGDEEGSVQLVCVDGNVFAHIEVENRIFEIQTYDDGSQILTEFDKTELAKGKTVTAEVPLKGFDNDSKETVVKGLHPGGLVPVLSKINVLVFYTDKARLQMGNITTFGTACINQMNEILKNSLLDGHIKMTLATTPINLSFNEKANDIKGDLDNFAENSFVQQKRDQYNADLVVLLTDGNYEYGETRGIAYKGPIDHLSYSIVEADAAMSVYTFSHELGHLLGGRHENEPLTSARGYDFLYGFLVFQYRAQTLMYQGSKDRIKYYSNPNQEYKGSATGDFRSNDVAAKMRSASPIVSKYRNNDVPSMSVNITGPTSGENGGTFTWIANVSGGLAPYYYNWSYSTDGVNYTASSNGGKSFTYTLANNANLILKINMVSQDGQSKTDYHTVTNTNATGPVIIPNKAAPVCQPDEDPNQISEKSQLKSEIVEFTEFKLYPNPTDGNFSIAYSLDKQSQVCVKLFDTSGKLIQQLLNQELSAGFYTDNYNLFELKKGVYFVQITAGDIKVTKQIIISR